MDRWEHEFVGPIVAGHLDPLVARGRADLYSEFAAHVPIHVTAVSLGLPPSDQDLFVTWALEMTSPIVSADQRMAASRAVADYIAPLVAERRCSPRPDLLGVLVQARVPDDEDASVSRQALTDDELAVFARLLIIAGASTVFRAYGILLFALLTHPDQLDAVRADRSLVPAAIEESLRWDQPLAAFGRLTTRETQVGGVTIPEGCPVLAAVGAANHDPAVWPEPDRFDIFRDVKPHLSFGFGRHRCLGVNLARMELRLMLEATLDRLPNLRFDPDAPTPHLTGLTFRMPTALPVVWDRA
jgi:cytochrome P450